MSFGIAYNVKSKVRVCSPELFHRAIDSQVVADVCAQIKDALEAALFADSGPASPATAPWPNSSGCLDIFRSTE